MINFRADFSGSGLTGWLVPAGVLAVAVFAGMATAVVGGQAGLKSVYYAAVFGLLGAGVLIAMTRDEPLRLAYLALFLSFPIANALVPPGRVGLKIFDVVMIGVAVVLIGKRLLSNDKGRQPLFPGRSMTLAWVLSVPVLVFSVFPAVSAQIMAVNAGVYAFFLMSLRELQRDGGFERIATILAVIMLAMDAGLFIDHFLHINLSLRGSNLNQISHAGGMEIWRAGGFFQDPQIAGAFLACTITFMLLLLIRGRFSGTRLRFVAAAAIVLSLAALITTVSRGAIISCVLVSASALFLFNRWSGPMKFVSVCAFLILAFAVSMMPLDALVQAAPRAIAERFQDLGDSFDSRLIIWFDTWDMFADHPLTGIGMGSFQSYLLETRPGVFNYYGIGVSSGTVYVPGQPENGYLKILYEGGAFGALAALLVAGDALRRALFVVRRSARDSYARSEAIASMGALTTFSITFISLFTWTDARMSGLFTVLIAVIWWRSLELPRTKTARDGI